MLTVPYSRVLDEAVAMWEGDTSPNTYDADLFNRRIRFRATEFWEMFFWPEWMAMEQRQFRPTWAVGTQSMAGCFYYYPTTLAYYQCLVTNTGIPPVDPILCQVNYGNWALAQGDFSGLSQYEDDLSYAPGTQIIWPTTQLPYQALVQTAVGDDPSDTSSWAPLTEFLRLIEFQQAWQTNTIAQVRRVWDLNPLIHPNANEIPFNVGGTGIVLRGTTTIQWVEFRLPANDWYGAVFDPTRAYATGNRMYFQTPGGESDYYVAAMNTTAGQSPATNPASWTLVPFPYVLKNASAHAAYADILKIDGQADKAAAELSEASRLIRVQFDKLERQQGQTRPLKVVNNFNANAFWG